MKTPNGGYVNSVANGWKPIPIVLKIFSILILLWTIGSILNIPQRYSDGLPFFGMFLSGLGAVLVVALLDIFGPLFLLLGIWLRKPWAPIVAYVYMGVFLLNGIIALFTVIDIYGPLPIIIPNLVELLFLIVILFHRKYFKT